MNYLCKKSNIRFLLMFATFQYWYDLTSKMIESILEDWGVEVGLKISLQTILRRTVISFAEESKSMPREGCPIKSIGNRAEQNARDRCFLLFIRSNWNGELPCTLNRTIDRAAPNVGSKSENDSSVIVPCRENIKPRRAHGLLSSPLFLHFGGFIEGVT